MDQYLKTTKTYIVSHKKEFIIGLSVLAFVALLIALFIYNSTPQVKYQPASACKLFTPSEAQDLLGDKIIDVGNDSPIISGNIATSKCSYTDSNPTEDSMLVAAVAVRSGINDKGVLQNKSEFATNRSSATVTLVNNIGDSAFFNPDLGQLNILDGRNWIIISNGVGSTPEANTLDSALKLAHKVVK